MKIKNTIPFFVLLVFSMSFSFAAEMGTISTDFTTQGIGCTRTTTSASWYNISFVNENTQIRTLALVVSPADGVVAGNCLNYSNQNNGHACCPLGKPCDGSNGTGQCNLAESLDYCFQAKTETACNSSNFEVSAESLNPLLAGTGLSCSYYKSWRASGQDCYNYSSCGCSWNNNKCAMKVTQKSFCGDTELPESSCQWVVEGNYQDGCSDPKIQKIIVNYSAVNVGNFPDCIDKTEEYPCFVSVKLPFFGLFNFLFSALFIAILYGMLARKSNR